MSSRHQSYGAAVAPLRLFDASDLPKHRDSAYSSQSYLSSANTSSPDSETPVLSYRRANRPRLRSTSRPRTKNTPLSYDSERGNRTTSTSSFDVGRSAHRTSANCDNERYCSASRSSFDDQSRRNARPRSEKLSTSHNQHSDTFLNSSFENFNPVSSSTRSHLRSSTEHCRPVSTSEEVDMIRSKETADVAGVTDLDMKHIPTLKKFTKFSNNNNHQVTGVVRNIPIKVARVKAHDDLSSSSSPASSSDRDRTSSVEDRPLQQYDREPKRGTSPATHGSKLAQRTAEVIVHSRTVSSSALPDTSRSPTIVGRRPLRGVNKDESIAEISRPASPPPPPPQPQKAADNWSFRDKPPNLRSTAVTSSNITVVPVRQESNSGHGSGNYGSGHFRSALTSFIYDSPTRRPDHLLTNGQMRLVKSGSMGNCLTGQSLTNGHHHSSGGANGNGSMRSRANGRLPLSGVFDSSGFDADYNQELNHEGPCQRDDCCCHCAKESPAVEKTAETSPKQNGFANSFHKARHQYGSGTQISRELSIDTKAANGASTRGPQTTGPLSLRHRSSGLFEQKSCPDLRKDSVATVTITLSNEDVDSSAQKQTNGHLLANGDNGIPTNGTTDYTDDNVKVDEQPQKKSRSSSRGRRSREKRKQAEWQRKLLEEWTLDDIILWLQTIGLDDVASLMIGYDLNGADVSKWTEEVLENLGVTNEAARRCLLAELVALKRSQDKEFSRNSDQQRSQKKAVPPRVPLYSLVQSSNGYDQILAFETPMTTRDVTVAESKQGGLQITRVNGKVPLREGDCILEVNNRPAHGLRPLVFTRLIMQAAGEPMRLVVLRRHSTNNCGGGDGGTTLLDDSFGSSSGGCHDTNDVTNIGYNISHHHHNHHNNHNVDKTRMNPEQLSTGSSGISSSEVVESPGIEDDFHRVLRF